jgi:hypothetical protein
MSEDLSYYQQVENPHYRYLKQFQCARLRDTYADFIAQPQYTSACHFFFNRLYSSQDTHDRDAAFQSIYSSAKKFLSGDVIESMAKLIDLQELTIELDQRLLEVLESEGAPMEFDMDAYERAYVLSDNRPGRVRQIELLEFTLRLVHSISHRLGIGMVLGGLRAASLLVGDTRMVDFLYDGYKAFVDLRDIEPFAQAMGDREHKRLDRIYALL